MRKSVQLPDVPATVTEVNGSAAYTPSVSRRAGEIARIATQLLQSQGMSVEHYSNLHSPKTANDADNASIEEARDVEASVMSVNAETAELTRRAIEKIQEGTFGNCDGCFNQIPLSRMKAVPNAIECMECRKQTEGSRHDDRAARKDFSKVTSVASTNDDTFAEHAVGIER